MKDVELIPNKAMLINLGCGQRTHPAWYNIDDFPNSAWRKLLGRTAALPTNFINHDLRKGIPFPDETADAVYSSHLLEHLPPESVDGFIIEQRRVLKRGGVIRIVVPDLEIAVRRYLQAVEAAASGSEADAMQHEWATIYLLDQMVRTIKGGRLQSWLIEHRDTEFVRSMDGIFQDIVADGLKTGSQSFVDRVRAQLPGADAAPVSEKHKWMYDRVSLARLLHRHGFHSFQVVEAGISRIAAWATYNLDQSAERTLHQPGSIYVEAIK